MGKREDISHSTRAVVACYRTVDWVWRVVMGRVARSLIRRLFFLRRDDNGMQFRVYPSRGWYRLHQRLKLFLIQGWLRQQYEPRFESALADRLASLPVVRRGVSVVCLGARLGAEVRAFLRHGCFAVGIDLNPGKSNLWVLPGDFHNLQFADRSVGIIYTNSLDHVLDLNQVLGEVQRVLAPGGVFIVEAVRGIEEGGYMGDYESFMWPTLEALVARLEAGGFSCKQHTTFSVPWEGVMFVCRPEARRGAHAVRATPTTR